MGRKEVTAELGKLLESKLHARGDILYMSKEVTFDFGTSCTTRVDYMVFKPQNTSPSGIEKGDFYCYEIKSCVEDFKSGHGLNFHGDYNYLVMPHETYLKLARESTLPPNVGILCPVEGQLETIISARRKNRKKSVSEMLFCMFRSACREYSNRIAKAESDAREAERRRQEMIRTETAEAKALYAAFH